MQTLEDFKEKQRSLLQGYHKRFERTVKERVAMKKELEDTSCATAAALEVLFGIPMPSTIGLLTAPCLPLMQQAMHRDVDMNPNQDVQESSILTTVHFLSGLQLTIKDYLAPEQYRMVRLKRHARVWMNGFSISTQCEGDEWLLDVYDIMVKALIRQNLGGGFEIPEEVKAVCPAYAKALKAFEAKAQVREDIRTQVFQIWEDMKAIGFGLKTPPFACENGSWGIPVPSLGNGYIEVTMASQHMGNSRLNISAREEDGQTNIEGTLTHIWDNRISRNLNPGWVALNVLAEAGIARNMPPIKEWMLHHGS